MASQTQSAAFINRFRHGAPTSREERDSMYRSGHLKTNDRLDDGGSRGGGSRRRGRGAGSRRPMPATLPTSLQRYDDGDDYGNDDYGSVRDSRDSTRRRDDYDDDDYDDRYDGGGGGGGGGGGRYSRNDEDDDVRAGVRSGAAARPMRGLGADGQVSPNSGGGDPWYTPRSEMDLRGRVARPGGGGGGGADGGAGGGGVGAMVADTIRSIQGGGGGMMVDGPDRSGGGESKAGLGTYDTYDFDRLSHGAADHHRSYGGGGAGHSSSSSSDDPAAPSYLRIGPRSPSKALPSTASRVAEDLENALFQFNQHWVEKPKEEEKQKTKDKETEARDKAKKEKDKEKAWKKTMEKKDKTELRKWLSERGPDDDASMPPLGPTAAAAAAPAAAPAADAAPGTIGPGPPALARASSWRRRSPAASRRAPARRSSCASRSSISLISALSRSML